MSYSRTWYPYRIQKFRTQVVKPLRFEFSRRRELLLYVFKTILFNCHCISVFSLRTFRHEKDGRALHPPICRFWFLERKVLINLHLCLGVLSLFLNSFLFSSRTS